MALTLDCDVTAEAISGDYFTGTITDETADYGVGGDPLRSAGALYITGEKINADGTVDSDLEFTYVADYQDTWSTITFTIPKDGWHKFKIVFIRDYDAGTSYTQYEAVYDPASKIVYRATAAGPFSGQAPPNASYWEVVSEPTSLVDNVGGATDSPNLEYQLLQRVLCPNAKVLFGNKAEDAAIEGYGDSTRGEDVLTYEFVRLCVEAINSLDQRGKQADGERVCRKVEEFANL